MTDIQRHRNIYRLKLNGTTLYFCLLQITEPTKFGSGGEVHHPSILRYSLYG